MSATRTPRPHRDVADRVRFFLDAAGLSREAFVHAVDGAIGARSLYSILNGSRRPSRALAVLIERTWGFRADFLLDGEGEVWTDAQPLGPGVVALELSPAESAVIKFMRDSVENARTIVAELEQARAWSSLFARTLALTRELDACGSSQAEADRRMYPLLAKVVYDDCRFMGSLYEQLVVLLHRRRIRKLSDDFLVHFLDELPRNVLPTERHGELRALLRPVLQHRNAQLDRIQASIDGIHTTVENLASLGSLADRLRARRDDPPVERRLQAALAGLGPGPLQLEVQSLLGEVASDPDPGAAYWLRLQRLLRHLLSELDQDVPVVPALSVEDLDARYESLLDPLTA